MGIQLSKIEVSDKVLPLTPAGVKETFTQNIDPFIIQSVNNILVRKYNSRSITFTQDEVLEEYFKINPCENSSQKRQDLFDRHQLDFEDLFRKYGWNVKYDKPGYNELYKAFFEFTPARAQYDNDVK